MPPIVGFIGLGAMGEPMARNLLRGGVDLVVYNRTATRGARLLAEGARAAASPAEVGRSGADVVFTMVADDTALRDTLFGADGLLEGLPKGAVHVSCSTVSVQLSRDLAAAHAEHGHGYVSMPVLGRPTAAAGAQLAILMAGAADARERCTPYLSLLGKRTFVLGDDPVLANTSKLVCNFLIISLIESLGEGFQLAERSGVAPAKILEILTETIFGAPVVKTYGDVLVNERFEEVGFRLPLGLKDVRLVLAAAEEVLAPMPIANVVRDHMLIALANGQENLDWASFVKVLAAPKKQS
jgi:3-hydroxyisobutyrate dehydrogenase-like beta-hydroxyacid dehydrogenase